MKYPLLNLKAELARSSLQQNDLAKELGIHYSSLNNKLNGITKFNIEEAFKICDLLNCNDIKMLFATANQTAN